jgi:hypothetical protein
MLRAVGARSGRAAARATLLATAAAYVANAAIGTIVAVDEGLPGRPFGIATGLSPATDFLFGLGTALSPPLGLLVALAVVVLIAVRGVHRAAVLSAVAGAGLLLGMLAEPITYRVLSPGGFDLVLAAIVALNLVLPVILGLSALRVARR